MALAMTKIQRDILVEDARGPRLQVPQDTTMHVRTVYVRGKISWFAVATASGTLV